MEFPMVHFRGDAHNSLETARKGSLSSSMHEELGSSFSMERFASNLEEHEVLTSTGICQRVYVQPSKAKMAMITYHDIGTNHTSFLGFFNYPEMRVLAKHFTVYHVCAPGHHENAANEVFRLSSRHNRRSTGMGEALLDNGSRRSSAASNQSSPDAALERPSYPTMDELAQMLTSIVVHFGINYFVGLGVGAGSNILTRYALHNSNNVMGLFLINPTATTHTYFQRIRCSWWDLPYLQQGYLTDNLLEQLDSHWFGYGRAENQDVVNFYHQLARSLNPVNVAGYIRSFMERTAINLVRPTGPTVADSLGTATAPSEPTVIKTDVCLVTGDQAVDLARTLAEMNGQMDPKKTQFITIPDCTGMVMEENPEKLVVDLLHFLRSIGLLINLTPQKLHKQATELQRQRVSLDGPGDNGSHCPALLEVEAEVGRAQPV